MIKKALPKVFRHLFSKKEIRSIENESNIKFIDISFGHITNSEKFNEDVFFQSSLHPVSINAVQGENNWNFKIHQSGFRNELIPEKFDAESKLQVRHAITNYILKIEQSIETDFLKQPQLWIYLRIRNGEVDVSTREIK
ncbi:hypothetical protein [Marinifilum caeruleilacunae]|uniref:Uncharacterized protein n=1 Tax=Marinifilum caeruleilacunae TaxID=2499076 RepID=A0ABX1WU39_9BACT|nr:hypothetical protein [Marinifilum caeruleilacunae]NOU59624.1 hypothetical protein [Marinifilum caeruleilacunae]